ncbi:MAG: hypothetical protein HOP19_06445, partial [Acidobacteria bacterium]|nr:hypothetical protein [Acidobacteriota bacterium]
MPHLRNFTLLTLAVISFAMLQGWHFSSAQTVRALPPQAPSSQQPVAAAPRKAKMLGPLSSPSSFSNTAAITINNFGNAAPYPSNISVSGVSSLFTRLEVTLNGFAHTFPDEVDIILVGPQGQRAILMSDAGGSDDVTGLNLTFAQTATTPIPDATTLATGTFRPTNYENGFNNFTDTFPAPGPGALTDAPA